MDMRSNKEKKQAKERHTTLLIDEEEVEDFPLTAPQPTQDCASDEDENFGLDVEDDIPWKPRDFSELNSRIQQRQKQHNLQDQEELTSLEMVRVYQVTCMHQMDLHGRAMHLLLEECWSNQKWKNLRQKRIMARHNNDKFSNEDNILLFCFMLLRY